jgi:hypothetical protein
MPRIEVSNGDLADKISILEIKKRKLTNLEQLKNVERDLQALTKELTELQMSEDAKICYRKLYDVNEVIWDLMQKLFENNFQDSETFESVAKATVDCNMNRAYLKRQFDVLTASSLHEEKSYFAKK